MVGVKERFYPMPTLQHVVAPAVRAGHKVDFFALISLQHQGKDNFRQHWYKPVPNPEYMNFTASQLEEYLVRHARYHGASRVGIFSLQNNVDVDPLPQHIFTNKRYVGERHGLQEENDNIFTTSTTFWLFLRRLKKTEMLWNWTMASPMDQRYDHVVLVQSDVYWVRDLDIANFPERHVVYSRHFGALCRGHFWNDTDTLSDPKKSRHVGDNALVFGGEIAGQMMTQYSAFFRIRKSPLLDAATSSEDFTYRVARLRRVRWEIAPKDQLAYFKALHMQQPKRKAFLCFRGITSQDIAKPTSECVEPRLIHFPLCDEFELQ